MERAEVLSTTTYVVLIWTMLEDGCQFFSTIISRDDFEGDKLMADAKPKADLLNTCRMLRKTLPIKPVTFPVKSERQEPRGGYQGKYYRADDTAEATRVEGTETIKSMERVTPHTVENIKDIKEDTGKGMRMAIPVIGFMALIYTD